MIAMLANLFEGMSAESFLMVEVIVAVVGLIVLAALFVLEVNEEISILWFPIGFIIIFVFLVSFVKVENYKINEEKKEEYHTCVKDGYTVYLNGEKVSHPNKMILDEYDIEFNDEDKEILLHK